VPAPDLSRPGAYGLAVSGLADSSLLVPALGGWPSATVEVARRTGPLPPTSVTAEAAAIPLREGTLIEVERRSATVRVSAPGPLEDAHLAHPLLGFAAVVLSHWAGRECFHGGAFVSGPGAWGVLGTTSSGKSTLLAALSLAGCEIVADDFLVANRGCVYAGPRCLDLRDPVPARLGIEGDVAPSPRGRPRLRVGPTRVEQPLAGWLVLEWGDEPDLVPIPAAERLGVLARERIWPPLGTALGLLELAALPAWRLRRPRRLGALRDTVALVLAGLAARREPDRLQR
jgi:hypothetical protein